MNLPLLIRTNSEPRPKSELCADGRIVPLRSGGMYLHLGTKGKIDSDPFLQELDSRPRMPQIVPLSFGPDGLSSPLVTNYLGRLPTLTLDQMMYVPPKGSLQESPDEVELAKWADGLGIPVQVPVGQLTPGRTLPSGRQHRVLPLDSAGRITSVGEAHSIRVLPKLSRAVGVHANPGHEVARMAAGRPYLSGRIVFGPDGVELGVPAGLVEAWFGDTVTRLGRPLDEKDVAAALADKTASTVQVDGYVELMRRLEALPPQSQALVGVADGADSAVHLAQRDLPGVSFLDPGAARAASFPNDPTRIELTVLPDTMALADRLDVLDAARYAAEPPASWPIRWPDGAAVAVDDTRPDRDVVVIGSAETEQESLLNTVYGAIGKLDQPVIVLAVEHTRTPLTPARIAAVRTLLEQYGWRNRVPVVVTRGQTSKDLFEVLDSYGAALVHRVAAASTASGGLSVNFGPQWNWTVRQPGNATVRQPGNATGVGSTPGVQSELTLPLLLTAAGRHRTPRFGRPPEQVATFLSTSLTEHLGDGRLAADLQGPGVKTLKPLVEQIALRDPSFAAHDATLQLADLGQGDAVVNYLGAGEARGDAIFEPLVNVDAETAQATVAELLPHLATLAGGGLNDFASQAILTAIAGQLDGSMTPEQINKSIEDHKAYLPRGGRADWVRRIGALQDKLPDHQLGLAEIGTMIMQCPD
ncbi:hypothetical protein ACH4OY_26840 [Micromonospora rubida]|uniref:Uncharacterized protein n=1 Tax=Micromonospora rubida TaxID=2697657 RepID=A0ABW7SUB1_9ACTN